jgi:CheY-like chemotaxis protein
VVLFKGRGSEANHFRIKNASFAKSLSLVTMTSKVVFIADDDPEDSAMISEALLEVDDTVVTRIFSNGLEVLSELAGCADQELPDCLILDYNMPELTGYQVLQKIITQARFAGIAKFVLSTSSATHFMNECLKTGASAYFVKPNSVTELRSIAKKMLQPGS